MKKRFCLSKKLPGAEPPTELRIFASGINSTDHGPVLFDQEAALAVMKVYNERGNELPFDYAHAMADENARPEDEKAAGWFKPEVRQTDNGPELWATSIVWTPAAEEGIRNKEWRYFSPWILREQSSGRVVEFFNIALTNLPAMHDLEPLVAKRPLDCRRLQLSMSFEIIVNAIQRALDARTEAEGTGYALIVDVYDDSVVYERRGKLYRIGYLMAGSSAVLSGEPVEVLRTYEPLVSLEKKPLSAAVNKSDRSAAARSFQMKDALILALGLKAEAAEAEVLSAVHTNLETQRKLLSLTGEQTVSAAMGKVEAWQKSAEALPEVQAQIQKFEAAAKERRVNDLLSKGKSEHKVTVAEEPALRSKGIEDPEWLEGYLAAKPVHVALAGITTKEPQVQSTAATYSGKAWGELSWQEKTELKSSNPELFATLRSNANQNA